MTQFIYMFIFAVIYLLSIAVAAGFLTVVERRIAGRMQSRIGPNRVGPQGIVQWIADAVKALQKEDIIPTDAHSFLFKIAPYLVFMGVFLTLVPIPFGAYTLMENLDTGIFYVLAMASFVVIGVMMGGWASNNKWSLLGGMRSAAQMISYEVPAALAVFVVVVMAGTLNFQKIVFSQGASPVDWYVFRNPFAFIAFNIFFIAALAEGNRVPFDIPEAESELVSGYNTEYSGMRFLFFFLAEWGNLVVIGALVSTLFFGGWNFWFEYTLEFSVPGRYPIRFEVLGFLWFLFKVSIFVFIIIWIRWTLPRLRIDQLMDICWKYMVPIGLFASIGILLWMYFVPEKSLADTIMRYSMTSFGGLTILYFFYRVFQNLRVTKAKIYANPFV
ncbi:MAG: NADH-quinone oxidoreductase subunit NuoH [Spirochaetia bacterium]|nr:NADH-quinone oxidoreductase subunit NuoH [Spirochaetia bacterium]